MAKRKSDHRATSESEGTRVFAHIQPEDQSLGGDNASVAYGNDLFVGRTLNCHVAGNCPAFKGGEITAFPAGVAEGGVCRQELMLN